MYSKPMQMLANSFSLVPITNVNKQPNVNIEFDVNNIISCWLGITFSLPLLEKQRGGRQVCRIVKLIFVVNLAARFVFVSSSE